MPSAITGRYGVVALSVMAMPIAGAASLLVRFSPGRTCTGSSGKAATCVASIVVGSAYAAADLANILTRDPHVGMRVIGVCVPRADVARAREAGLTVLGDLDEVPELIRAAGADAVAVTGGDCHPAQLPAPALLGPRGRRASSCWCTPA